MHYNAQSLETDFSLQDFLAQIETAISSKLKQKHQNFAVRISRDMPAAIIANQQKLMGIISQLLENAHKCAPEGGNIALYIMKTLGDGQRCRLLIEVENDGGDILAEQANSWRIARDMGGEAWVEARPQKVCVFSFTIEAGVGKSSLSPPTD